MEEYTAITADDLNEEQRQKALIFYATHLNRLRRYNKNHKEEINEKAKQSYRNIKENPERYEIYKERRKELYRQRKVSAT